MRRLAKYTIALLAAVMLLWPDWSHAVDSGVVENPAQGIIVVRDDLGGTVEDHLKFWNRIRIAGIPVRVDGYCYSACTLVLTFPASQVCVTNKASFGFHLASVADKPVRDYTARMVKRYYPPAVQNWIKRHGPLTPEIKAMQADEALELGLVHSCDDKGE